MVFNTDFVRLFKNNPQIAAQKIKLILTETKNTVQHYPTKKELDLVQSMLYLNKLNQPQLSQLVQTTGTNYNQQSEIELQIGQQESIQAYKLPFKVLQFFEIWSNKIEFDPFKLQKISNQNGLFYYLYYISDLNNIIHSLKLDLSKFVALCQEIQNNYKQNPYHNITHALDVTQTLNFLFKKCRFQELASLNHIELISSYLAAAAHDLDHPGFNNLYLINTEHDLAIQYNDKAVLENYHCSLFFQLIGKECLNILEKLDSKDQKQFRTIVISMILATDMSIHFVDLENLKKIITNKEEFDIQDKHKQVCLNTLIHAADISNPVKNIEIYYKWAELVIQEFFNQGDHEREQQLTISYLCDRNTVQLPQSQIGFIDFIVFPLYDQISIFLPKLKKYLKNFDANKKYFQLKIMQADYEKQKDQQEVKQKVGQK